MDLFRKLRDGMTVLLIAIPVLVFAWAYGGLRGDVLRAVMPWASIVCLCGILVLPQSRPEESVGETWCRVGRQIVRDPFVWTFLVFATYMFLPLLNEVPSPLQDGGFSEESAPSAYLPFCVSRTEHLGVVCWFLPTLLSALGARHALTRVGKRALFELLVWNGALLAVFGFVQIFTRAHFPFWEEVQQKVHFFSVFAYPNAAGAFFTLNLAMAFGLWIYRIEVGENLSLTDERGLSHSALRAHYPFWAAALSFFAVLATLSRAAIVLSILLTVLFFVYVIFRPLAEEGLAQARRFRSILSVGSLILVAAAVAYIYAPPDIGRELNTVNLFSISDRVTGKAQYHTRVATSLMRDYPLFGVGGWGYRHFSMAYLKRENAETSVQMVGGANVHNDYLQFLAEQGAVGFLLMAFCFYWLVRPTFQTWGRLIRVENARARSGMGTSSLAVFSVCGPVFWIFLGSMAVLIHAFGDCPLRSAAVLSLLCVVQVLATGFLPHLKEG